jgi:hypothetical protein
MNFTSPHDEGSMMELPETLYVQVGMTGASEELFTNSSPERALGRLLGDGRVAGETVGIYRLDRLVQIKAGIMEVPKTEPGVDAPPPQPANV